MSKYPEDKPFGKWTPEQQREFKIDVLVDGKDWQSPSVEQHDSWVTREGVKPLFGDLCRYRLAPEPQIPDSIEWSHVHPDIVKMHRVENWEYANFINSQGQGIGITRNFASYKRGNMESCTVYRPGFEPEVAK
ncbi:hypothetical protein ACQUFY_06325 [Robbsia andropogonis]|uniref:hypothetical protein n=1 Tax=Robbsia andropogonis TaxID=28092 RepID=UPI003D21ACF6